MIVYREIDLADRGSWDGKLLTKTSQRNRVILGEKQLRLILTVILHSYPFRTWRIFLFEILFNTWLILKFIALRLSVSGQTEIFLIIQNEIDFLFE